MQWLWVEGIWYSGIVKRISCSLNGEKWNVNIQAKTNWMQRRTIITESYQPLVFIYFLSIFLYELFRFHVQCFKGFGYKINKVPVGSIVEMIWLLYSVHIFQTNANIRPKDVRIVQISTHNYCYYPLTFLFGIFFQLKRNISFWFSIMTCKATILRALCKRIFIII